jgi:hypothetical protein
MVPRSNALSIFPSIGSLPRRPLPSSGSLWVRFPGLIGTMGRSDFLPSIPGGSLTRPPVPSSRCLIRSRRRPAPPTTGQGFGLPAPLPASQRRRQQDLPSSRQILSMQALLPSDPGGTGAPGHSASAMLPSASDTASAPTTSEFRGSITRPASSLSTLRSDGYPSTTQDSLPGGGQPYPGGTRPAGSVRKVSETTHLTSSLSPSPSFARRTPRSHVGLVVGSTGARVDAHVAMMTNVQLFTRPP